MTDTTPRGFTIHDRQSAPADACGTLGDVAGRFGGVLPQFFAVAANSPAALKGYVALNDLFRTETGLSETEQEVALLAVSLVHSCQYCLTVHTIAVEDLGLDRATVRALRQGEPTGDARLDAVVELVNRLHATGGWLTQEDLDGFYAAGFGQGELFDVVLAYAAKTLSNFINHIAQTPVDPPMAAREAEREP